MVEVKLPFSAKVLEVLVKPGDKVSENQVLLKVEAMKMEFPVTAPSAGVVREVRCASGEAVDGDSTIVTID